MAEIPHDSGRAFVTGSAEYIDDRPALKGELHLELILSPHAHAKIKRIDASAARALPGVAGVFTAEDIPHNLWGTIYQDQPLLASDKVQYVGEVVAIVAAEDKSILRRAKALVEVEYEVLKPILTIDGAQAAGEFFGLERHIARGDVSSALKSSPHRLKGQIRMAGQDHFYLESQAAVAIPQEEGQIEVHASSQHPSEVQHLIAHALGIGFHQVVCVVKRMGGAFGGKESQAAPFGFYAALVAHRTGRPARIILTKDDDMLITGKRNPFQNDYEVGFDSDGRILALQARFFSDGGAYADLSTAIMERAMLHLDNAYFIEHFEVVGRVCKTHTAPNTAFRGFGGPKGMVTVENIIEDIAQYLAKDAAEVRRVNVYRKGQTTPYGQVIEDDVLPTLFETLERDSRYEDWRKSVTAHNAAEVETLRGLSVTAVKFGISFTTRFLNQGSALVNIHLDGTVQVSTGATEMGQGVNTKIAQVVAETFGIPASDVRVMPTSTEKIPNTSPTAASSGADINCAAAVNASQAIRERLARTAELVLSRPDALRGRKVAGSGVAPELDLAQSRNFGEVEFESGRVKHRGREIAFGALVEEAYLNRVALSAHGFFRYPGIHFNKETGQGHPFFYYTNGVAASEVAIDRITGEVKVMRTDLLMDLGRPIHEGIDLGQVTGAFVQGMGWVTTENLHYNDEGRLLTISPSTYKIPSVHDTPREFNVRLFENPLNSKNIRGSKAVGEPPLMLALSVWAAIKNALQYGHQRPVVLPIPATQERVLLTLRELEKHE